MNRQQRRAEKSRKQTETQTASPAIQDVYAGALRHHQAGHLNEAERLYRQVLAVHAGHADTLHLLGLLTHQSGRSAEAVELIRKAIAISPEQASFHFNAGTVSQELGRLDEAIDSYRQAIALHPGYAEAHNNMGNALRAQGRPREAVACFRAALALLPDFVEAHNNLGNALGQLGRLDEAISCFRRALELQPDHSGALSNLGNALRDQGRLEEGIACYRKALELRPDFAEGHNNLGNALRDLGRPEEAIASFRRALAIRPNFPEVNYNLGITLRETGGLDEAIACYRRALTQRPNYPWAYVNLGNALAQQRRLDEALDCFNSALELQPDNPDAHNNLGMLLLARGELETGWKEYEWRWSTPSFSLARRDFPQPQWRGEPARGRTLLIHAEQGYGDTLQFCRFAETAAGRGFRVVLEVQPPLVRLSRGLTGVDQVVGQGDALPSFDLHCPILSMPLALGTTLATIPRRACYLRADPAQFAAWRTRLARTAGPGRRVGLVWAGNSRAHSPALAATDRRRSMPPDRLAPLFEVAGMRFFSLQKAGPEAPGNFPLIDFMNEMDDFADTAALIANLDLVISVDTAVAHLAAALGKPVWLLDRFDSCWRWLTGRRDSPWYPTMRLFRQPTPGDWTSVVAEAAADLRLMGLSNAGR